VRRCNNSMWKSFRQYHYLNGKLGAGVRCYASFYNQKPVAFIAVVHTRMKSNYFRVSRLVVLPDYQGIGLGKRLLNFTAEFYTSQINLPFYIVTSNPQLVRGNLGNWRVKRVGHGSAGSEDTRINSELTKSNSKRRLSVTLQYLPSKKRGA
jgi:GNAT superfamily N-acetyltransferase